MVATTNDRTNVPVQRQQAGDGAQDPTAGTDPKAKLRGLGYDDQVAALKPADGPPPPDRRVQKKEDAAPAADKAPQKTRSQILRDQASKMETIDDLMSYGAFDWEITDADATKALFLLACMPDGEAPVVVQNMKPKSMNRLVDNAPADARVKYPLSYITVITMGNRVAEVEQVLDYHPSLAGVTPKHAGRAEIGWLMAKVSSPFVKRMGQNANGAPWFQRWLELTPEPQKASVTAAFTAAQQEKKDADAAQAQRKAEEERIAKKFDPTNKDADKDTKSLLARVSTIQELLSYSVGDICITDADAKKVLGLLNMADPDAIRFAVRQLDKGPFMDRFIDNLNPNDRWQNKRTFLNIMAARAPEKNIKYVTELLSYGVFDWAVTDEEARLAFYLVKTMPKDVRDKFKVQDGGKWWGRMEENLDQDTKTAKDAHFYDNKEEVQKKKLEFKDGGKTMAEGQLRMAIEMLVRMGEEDFVEKELQGLGWDKAPERDWIYKEYGFAKSGAARDPKVWKTFKDKTAGEKFVDGLAQVGAGVGIAASALGQALIRDPIEAAVTGGKVGMDLDLNLAQTANGGDLEGMKLASKDKTKEGNNQLHLGFDIPNYKASISVASLSIASVAKLVGDTRVTTGAIDVDALQLDIKWPSPSSPEAYYKLTLKGLGAHDIWLTTETAMTGIGSVRLSELSLFAKPIGAMPQDKMALMGGVLKDVQQALTRLIGMIDAKDPQPEQIGAKMGKDFIGAADAQVSLGALEVKDVAQSAGGYVGTVAAQGLQVSMSSKSKGDAVRARLAAIAEEEKKEGKLDDKVKAEKAELEASLPAIIALEKRRAELLAKKTKDGELQPGDAEELTHTNDQLMISTAEVGVKGLQVKDVDSGGVKAESLEVADLKAKVSGERNPGKEAGAMDMLPKGQKPKPDSKVQVELSVGSVKGSKLVLSGKSKLESYEAKINEVQAQIDAKSATPDDVKLYESLKNELRDQRVHEKIIRRDELHLKGPSALLAPELQEELERLESELEEWVGKAPSTSIDSLSAVGKDGKPALAGKVDVATGRMSVDLADAEVKGVRTGDMKIDSAHVKGLSATAGAGADLRGGGLSDITKTLTDAKADVEKLEVKGLELGGRPQSVVLQEEAEKLTLKQRLNPKDLGPDDTKRLAELPPLIAAARKDETRLAELRALQQNDPAKFTPALEAELRSLADRADPKVTRVASAEMNNVSLKLDTKSGQVEVGAGKEGKDGAAGAPALKVDGVEIGQKRPDGSIAASTKIESAQIASIGVSAKAEGGPGVAGLDSLMDPKKLKDLQGQVDVKGIEIKNLELRSKTVSAELQAELDALTEKQTKNAAAMSPEDQKTLAELPAKLQEARAGEARLIELRRMQEQHPKEFGESKDLGWELKALAAKYDQGARKIGKVEVGEVSAKADTKAGKVEVGVKGQDGKPAVKIEGVEMGKVGPDGQMVTDTKVAAVKLDSLDASLETSPGAAALLDPMKSDKLKADVKGKGFEVKGVEKGKAGEAGSMKLDKASLDQVSAGYDKADGGKASLELQGMKLENFEMASTKLADLELRLGELLGKARSGIELTPDEKAELDQRKLEYAEYNDLKQKFATAINKQWRKYYGDKLAAWEKVKLTGAKKAELGKLSVAASDLGNKAGPKVDASLDKLKAEGVSAGDTTLNAASVGHVDFHGKDMLDADKRDIKADVKELEASGLKMPGTMVGKAKVQETNIALKGKDLDVKGRRASVSGAYSGGAGVGGASVGGFGVAIRGMGTEHETTSTALAGVNAQGISKGEVGGMTTIGKAHAGGIILQSGKGGGPGGSTKVIDGDVEDLNRTTTDKDGKVTTAHLDSAHVDQAVIRPGKNGNTLISADGVKVDGVDFSTDKKNVGLGSSESTKARVDSASVGHADLDLRKDGMSVDATDVKAKGAGYSSSKSYGNGQKQSEMTAGVGAVDATGVHLETHDDGKGTSSLGVSAKGLKVDDASYSNTTWAGDGSKKTETTAGVKSLEASTKSEDPKAEAVEFGMQNNADGSSRMKASVDEATIKGAHYDDKAYDDGGRVKKETSAHADRVDASGVKADVKTTAGGDTQYDVGAKKLAAKGVGYKEEKDGKVVRSVDGVNQDSLAGVKQAGINQHADSKADVSVTDLEVHGDKDQIYAEYGTIRGDSLVFNDASNPESKVKAVLTYFQFGEAGGPKSKVAFDKNTGRIDGDLYSIKIGDKSQIDFGKDPQSMVHFNDELSAGTVKLEKFDPIHVTTAGSKLEIGDIKGVSVLYNSTDRRVFVTGGTLEKLSVQGLGGGDKDGNGDEAVVGYEGAHVKQVKVFERDKTEKDSKTLDKFGRGQRPRLGERQGGPGQGGARA
ncbi:MAG: hypothetical protein U1F43_32590 [Myxococcota bacterium]